MTERSLSVDISSPVPVYRQVVDGLRALLVAGSFAVGEQLPTVRQVALDLGVHHNTVAAAYRELADEGWLELARRRGATVVARDRPAHPGARAVAAWRRRLGELIARGIADGLPAAAITDSLAKAAKQL